MRLTQLFHLINPSRFVLRHRKEPTVENNHPPFIYTEDQLMVRLKFFIGVCLALTLTGIVFVVLYSIIFVTQPLNAISPIDQKFFELIIPIATFLTGTLSGIMLAGNKKEDQDAILAAQKQAADNAASAAKSATVTAPAPVTNSWGSSSLGGGLGAGLGKIAPSFGSVPGADPAPAFGASDGAVTTGWGGKAAPPAPTAWPER